MKRFTQFVLACAMIVALVSVAAAQGTPTPVTRMGDWVEIGNDVFMNIIANTTIRYKTVHNMDFENDVRDRAPNASAASSSSNRYSTDSFFAEARFGVDMKYKKNLTMRVMLEAESLFDGNLIDDRNGDANYTTSCSENAAGEITCSTSQQRNLENSVHVERFWIDYKFPGTPIRMRVGAHLWKLDQAAVVSDDDPGIFFYATAGAKKEWDFSLAATMQREAARNRLVNDNDEVDYMAHIAYNMKPFKFALDFMFERDRFDGQGFDGTTGADHSDTALIMPSVTGKAGIVRFMGEFLFKTGSLETNTFRNGSDPDGDFDVKSWSFIGYVEADLGMIRPSIGIIYGSGDDDPTDDELEGFNPFSHADVQLISLSGYWWYDSPAYSNLAPCAAASRLCGGANASGTGYHTITNPYADRVLNTAHGNGSNTAYSNPGIITVPIGVRLFPVKQHQFQLWYIYVGFAKTELLEADARARGVLGDDQDISNAMMHSLGTKWIWTLSKHFDIHVLGQLTLPGSGMKDIAETEFQCGDTGDRACDGEDPQMAAEIQFRARF